jgi:PAS domain S-box-containing protein
MALDIPTVSLMITIVDLLYTLALIIQWRLVPIYAGPVWWALAMAATTLGFGLTYLRAIPSLALIGIFGNNVAFVLAATFFYIGVVRFYGRRERREWLIAALAVFIVADFYLTFIRNDIVNRRTVFNLTYALFIGAAALATAYYSKPARSVSALLLAAAFAFGSVSLILSAILNVLFPADPSPVLASLSQINSLLAGGLISNTLETLGVILVVNQRLSSETREANESLEHIFSTSPDSITVSSLSEGKIIRTNEAFATLSGYSQVESLGKSTTELGIWKYPVEREKFSSQLQKSGVYQNLEVVFQRKDGSLFTALVSARTINLHGIPHIISVTHDISERKRMEEELRAAHAELEERVRERTADLQTANSDLAKALSVRDDFLAAMSHELRTPLTGVLGLAQVLQLQTYGPLSEKQINALKNIENSGQHLLELINDILDYSQLQSGNLELNKKVCNLDEICRAALHKFADPSAKKHQKTHLQIEPADLRLTADGPRLKQILAHLLSNASKFTPETGQFGIEASQAAGEVRISVWDTGIGIWAEDIPRLFKPFVQIDARLARMYNGTGLGLAMVKNLVDLHDGRIELESTPGQGSRFTVILPAE